MVLARYYTKEEFGIWATITSTAAILATGDFGITNALRNKISNLYATNPKNSSMASDYFYSMFIFLVGFVSVIIFILTIFKNQIPWELLFKTSDLELQNQAKDIVFGIQIMYLINIPLCIGVPLFFSYQESFSAACISSIQSIISMCVLLGLVLIHSNIVTISLAYFGSTLFVSAIGTCYFIYKRKWFYYNFSINKFISSVKELLPKGFKFMFLQIGSSLLQNAGTICISSTVGVSSAAEFNIIQKLYTFFIGIYQSILNPLWGELSIAYAKKQAKRCSQILKKSIYVLIASFTIFSLILLFGGDQIIALFAGESYATSNSIILLVGLISFSYLLFANITILQNAIGQIGLMTIIIGVACLFIFMLSYYAQDLGIVQISIYLSLVWFIISGIMFVQSNLLLKRSNNEDY